MRNTRTILILSVVAAVLVFGIGACIMTKPLTAIGLAPILAAISLIIRAIRGAPSRRYNLPEHPRQDPAKTWWPSPQNPAKPSTNTTAQQRR